MAVLRRLIGFLLILEAMLLLLAAVNPGVKVSMGAALAASVLGPARYSTWLSGLWMSGAGLLGAAFVTAGWWLARGQKGARGLSAAILLLHVPVLGWGTAVGFAGLGALWQGKSEDGEQGIGSNPGWQMAIAAMGTTLWIYPALADYGRFIGMQGQWGDTPWLAAVISAELFFGWFHELGHWLALQVLGFEGGSIVWGSLAGQRGASGSWNWSVRRSNIRSWGTGYQSAAPSQMEGAGTAWALIALAGPGASLFSGLCFLLGMLMLPGSHLEAYWEWAALASAGFLGNALVNLLPVGGSDGAQILHTLARTKRGGRILAELEIAMYRIQGEQDEAEVDFGQKAELLAEKIETMRRNGNREELGALLAERGQALLENGEAELALTVLDQARAELSKEEGQAAELQAWTWLWTRAASAQLGRHTHAEMARVKATELIERVRSNNRNWGLVVELIAEAAQLHVEGGDPDRAVALCQEMMPFVPSRERMRPIAGKLHGLAAVAEFQMKHEKPAREHLRLALQKLNLTGNRPVLRRQCLRVQANLAERLLNCGQEELGIAVMRDAVKQAEELGPALLEGKIRMRLAAIYVSLGKQGEAGRVLEQGEVWKAAVEEDFSAHAQYRLLHSRVLLLAGKAGEAAKEAADALQWMKGRVEKTTENRAVPEGQAEGEKIRQACGLALLGEALRLSGNTEQAQKMARASCAELVPRNHIEALTGLTTLALLLWGESPEKGALYFREAMRIAAESNWEPPCARARVLERLGESLERAQKLPESQQAMAAAKQLRIKGAVSAPA